MLSGKKSPPARRSGHFKLSDILKATNNFDESLIIGRGYLGEVYKGEVSIRGMTVPAAITRLNPKSNQVSIDSWPWPEAERLFTLRHTNLVSLIGYCDNKENVKIVSLHHPSKLLSTFGREKILVHEYISNGTLKDHLHGLRTPLSWLQRLSICIGIARGLQYLHAGNGIETGVKHGDIRSSTILLTESLQPKISKVGLSYVGPTHEESTFYYSFPRGTFGCVDGYSLTSGRGLTMESDVYSFGVVLLELLFRMPALDESREVYPRGLVKRVEVTLRERDLVNIIDSDIRNEIYSACLHDFYDIAKRCLLKDPKRRPDMSEVVGNLESLLVAQERFNNSLPGRMVDTLPFPSDSDSQSPGPTVKKFTYYDLDKATRGFSQDLVLGETNVFKGWLEQNTLAPSEGGVGIAVAVKHINSGIIQSYNERLEEVYFLGQLAHPNIIRLVGYCSEDGHVNFLVYEHMKKSLSDLIHGDEALSWATRLNIMMGVVHGMTYLNSTKGMLCHFLCDDIFLDKDYNAKIGGFWWAKIEGIRLHGAFGYLKADYNISDGDLIMKNDIWSFGFVLLETITGRCLSDIGDILVGLESLEMRAPKSKSNRRKVKKMMDPRLKGSYSPEGAFKCMVLALRCIAIRTNYRPTREEILWSLEQICALNK